MSARAGEPGWVPDENLVAAARCGKVALKTLDWLDRCWVVAGLTASGMTAEEQAARLSCSLRLVRQIRAEQTTQALVYAVGMLEHHKGEAQSAHGQVRFAQMEAVAASAKADRLKSERDRLLQDLLDARRHLRDCLNRMPGPA